MTLLEKLSKMTFPIFPVVVSTSHSPKNTKREICTSELSVTGRPKAELETGHRADLSRNRTDISKPEIGEIKNRKSRNRDFEHIS